MGQAIERFDWNRTGFSPEIGNIVVPHVRWTFTVNGTLATGALALDVNRDGKKEVYFGEVATGSNPRFLYALDSDGHILWRFEGKYDLGPAAISDLNHDGLPEVIAEEGAHQPTGGLNLYVLNALNGSLIWKYTDYGTFWEEGFSSSPIIYDVNGDGIDDLTLGSFDRYVYTFNGKDGSILWKSSAFEHYIRTSPAFTDLDGDGEKDFVIWDNHAVTRAYSIKTHRLLWEQRLGYGVASDPAIGDLNGDGKPEIVFSLVVSGGITVLRGDGSVFWTNTNWTYFYHSPTLVDVNGDGMLDVIQGDSLAHTIVAYRGTDGVEFWHTTLPNTTWSQAALVSADIDGDKTIEILVGSDSGLFSLESTTGVINWLYPAYKVRGEPWIADLDGDGKAEILFGAGDRQMYVLDQMPPPRFEPRTIGYWKHQCNVSSPSGEHVGMPQSFIDAIRSRSAVFSNLTTPKQACDILWAEYKGDMMGMAKRQLLALWLNVVSGFVDPTVQIDLPKLTNATTVGGAILDTENTILTHTDKPSLERVKDLCDSINNGKIK
jgi:outer membrane protein assembly factor BamB